MDFFSINATVKAKRRYRNRRQNSFKLDTADIIQHDIYPAFLCELHKEMTTGVTMDTYKKVDQFNEYMNILGASIELPKLAKYSVKDVRVLKSVIDTVGLAVRDVGNFVGEILATIMESLSFASPLTANSKGRISEFAFFLAVVQQELVAATVKTEIDKELYFTKFSSYLSEFILQMRLATAHVVTDTGVDNFKNILLKYSKYTTKTDTESDILHKFTWFSGILAECPHSMLHGLHGLVESFLPTIADEVGRLNYTITSDRDPRYRYDESVILDDTLLDFFKEIANSPAVADSNRKELHTAIMHMTVIQNEFVHATQQMSLETMRDAAVIFSRANRGLPPDRLLVDSIMLARTGNTMEAFLKKIVTAYEYLYTELTLALASMHADVQAEYQKTFNEIPETIGLDIKEWLAGLFSSCRGCRKKNRNGTQEAQNTPDSRETAVKEHNDDLAMQQQLYEIWRAEEKNSPNSIFRTRTLANRMKMEEELNRNLEEARSELALLKEETKEALFMLRTESRNQMIREATVGVQRRAGQTQQVGKRVKSTANLGTNMYGAVETAQLGEAQLKVDKAQWRLDTFLLGEENLKLSLDRLSMKITMVIAAAVGAIYLYKFYNTEIITNTFEYFESIRNKIQNPFATHTFDLIVDYIQKPSSYVPGWLKSIDLYINRVSVSAIANSAKTMAVEMTNVVSFMTRTQFDNYIEIYKVYLTGIVQDVSVNKEIRTIAEEILSKIANIAGTPEGQKEILAELYIFFNAGTQLMNRGTADGLLESITGTFSKMAGTVVNVFQRRAFISKSDYGPGALLSLASGAAGETKINAVFANFNTTITTYMAYPFIYMISTYYFILAGTYFAYTPGGGADAAIEQLFIGISKYKALTKLIQDSVIFASEKTAEWRYSNLATMLAFAVAILPGGSMLLLAQKAKDWVFRKQQKFSTLTAAQQQERIVRLNKAKPKLLKENENELSLQAQIDRVRQIEANEAEQKLIEQTQRVSALEKQLQEAQERVKQMESEKGKEEEDEDVSELQMSLNDEARRLRGIQKKASKAMALASVSSTSTGVTITEPEKKPVRRTRPSRRTRPTVSVFNETDDDNKGIESNVNQYCVACGNRNIAFSCMDCNAYYCSEECHQ
jgi:hypothetical protein